MLSLGNILQVKLGSLFYATSIMTMEHWLHCKFHQDEVEIFQPLDWEPRQDTGTATPGGPLNIVNSYPISRKAGKNLC